MADQRVSPTAWYTAAVWAQRGLAEPALAAATPRAAHWAVWSQALLSRLTGFPRLDDALEHRHRILDAWVLQSCTEDGVQQVLEVPAGLASRAQRLLRALPGLTIVEGDLPVMVRAKRAALTQRSPAHHVVEVDLLSAVGPRSPAAVGAALLNPDKPLVVVMEGLTYYLTDEQLRVAFRTLRCALPPHPSSRLLLDAFLTDHSPRVAQRWAVRRAFARVPGVQRSEAHLTALATEAGWERTPTPTQFQEGPDAEPALLQVLGFRPAM